MSAANSKRRLCLPAKTFIPCITVAVLACTNSPAQQVGDPFILHDTGSCPAFHCDAEGTGVQRHQLPSPLNGMMLTATPLLPTQCGGSGQPACQLPGFQSCSSDDAHAICLFTKGPNAVIAFDVTDPGSPHNFTFSADPDPGDPASSMTSPVLNETSDAAVVALVGQDQSLIIADGNWIKRLRSDGSQVWPTSLSPHGVGDVGAQLGYETLFKHQRAAAGITPIQYQGQTAAAVTFRDGPTSDPRTYTNIVVFNLSDGTPIARFPGSTTDSSTSGLIIDGRAYYPASPPVSHGGSLYFAGYNDASQLGVLARLDLNDGALKLAHYQTFGVTDSQTFGGETGGSPLYVDATRFPKFPQDQVLIHVPETTQGSITGLNCRFVGEPANGGHLVSFSPDLTTCYWAAALNPNGSATETSALEVSPAVDPVIGGVWAWTTNFLGWSGQELYHFPAAGGAFDREINLPALCRSAQAPCGLNPSFVGHLQAINPPGTNDVYIASFISNFAGLGDTKSAIAIDTSAAAGDAGRIRWLAPITGLTGRSYGGSFPLVTLPGNGGPALIFSGGAFGASVGNVSIVQP